jgi:hypothetical protein
MTRPNDFPRKVKVAAVKRATRDGVMYCEGDGCGLPIKICRVDHVIPAGMGGKSTLDNARILGPCCWPEIDAKANRLVKYAAKLEEIRLGVKRHKRQFIKSRGFPPRAPKPSPCAPTSKTLPRRGI